MSKTESRFKSKLESLKKFQHSASANTAVEKARAFFRSLELKHLGSNSEHGSSSRRRHQTTSPPANHVHSSSSILSPPPPSKFPVSSSISSSSSSSIIDDSHATSITDSSYLAQNPPNGIATARIIHVINPHYSNPKDMIVHRVLHNEDEMNMRTSAYSNGQPTFTRISSPSSILSSKQYYHGTFTEPNQHCLGSQRPRREIPMAYDSHLHSPVSSLSPNVTYSTPNYLRSRPSIHSPTQQQHRATSHDQMSTSLYHYRPLVCRQMESSSLMSSSFHEETPRRPEPVVRSSSSMSTWTQSVRRLNTEYKSTINALQRAKESLEQIYPQPAETISKYANLVARGIDNLSNDSTQETKKSLGVTFCLSTPMSKDPSPVLTPEVCHQQNQLFPSTAMVIKPKLVRPVDLETFVASVVPIHKLEPVPVSVEHNGQHGTISNIIKKFNNLNTLATPAAKSPTMFGDDTHDSDVSQTNNDREKRRSHTLICDVVPDQFGSPSSSFRARCARVEPSRNAYELEEIPDESPPLSLSSSSTSSSSSVSDDSTSSTSTTTSESNPTYEPDPLDQGIQEETTYTVETFYKSADDDHIDLSTNHQQVVIIRENMTEEQFNSVNEKQHDGSTQHTFTISQSELSPLTTPLLTYLNLPVKRSVPMVKAEEKQEAMPDNYHSVQVATCDRNELTSLGHHNADDDDDDNNNDDESISDVVTINPHTHSPPLSSSSHRQISSSSTSSSTSSASTVLLGNKNRTPPSAPSTISQPSTNGHSVKNETKPISQLPKRLPAAANVSRLKQPTKSIPTTSKLKAPSTTITKSIKPMITNNSAVPTTSVRKPAGVANHSSTLTNNMINRSTHQQIPAAAVSTGKKSQLTNGTTMAESPNATDLPSTVGKNRVRSMVNQLNAAVISAPENKRVPVSTNTRRLLPTEPATNPTVSANKPAMASPGRSTLHRAMTITHNNSIAPISSPITNAGIPSSYKRKTPLIRSTSNVKEGLLRWCQAQVAGYPNVSVTNLSSSWSDGLAFCALTHHFFPDAFDFKSLSANNRQVNFELAFRTADERAGVPQLLDVSDMLLMGNTPDYKCVFTYLNSFLAKVKDIHPKVNGVEHH